MTTNPSAYSNIKARKEEFLLQSLSSEQLNNLHDQVLKDTFLKAFHMVRKEIGDPPCEFNWFVLGSAGRFEQGFISDQDHGIVYHSDTNEAARYFLTLGKELSNGLFEVGYPFCDGKVMSSNPLWCKSLVGWKEQLHQWALEESLDSIRYLQIFYDARSLMGECHYIEQLKQLIIRHHLAYPHLLIRFLDNIRHIKKSVGVFGQVFVQQTGPYAGSIDLKHSAFLPYVNAIRLLAIKEGILESSTLTRFLLLRQSARYQEVLRPFEESFRALLDFRLSTFKTNNTYADTHYLHIKNLNPDQKKIIKQILKDGEKLHHFVQKCIEKGC
ncbi:DUF294 nucleotidyltransferase-like domain-containing protein [Bacillus pinisoli]|uniref:DUF294 nucleotidyltransferase-like domain-containing protein n=1 Tax=Bacillus pinisoli TaxID=2901866 RepID=UPI001FF4E283|nr:DUF294 nucleotidyltransferase-like domain-containing protein [Bacillus pinisoli]